MIAAARGSSISLSAVMAVAARTGLVRTDLIRPSWTMTSASAVPTAAAAITASVGFSRSRRSNSGRASIAHVPECAGSRAGHRAIKVVKEIGQHGDHPRLRAGAAAGIGSDCRLGMTEEHQHGLGWQAGSQFCSGAHRTRQARPLHHAVDNDPGHGGCRVAPTDCGERSQHGNLLRHGWCSPNPLKRRQSACKGRNCRDQAAPSGFGCQGVTIGKTGIGDCGDQRRVIQALGCHTRPLLSARRGICRRRPGGCEQVRLLNGRHAAIMPSLAGFLNSARRLNHARSLR